MERIPSGDRRPSVNKVLSALTRNEYRRLLAGGDAIALRFGQILYEPGAPIRNVYFPIDCLVSLLTPLEGHRAREVGLVGRDGMVGAHLALGANVSPVRALVQGAGTALRITAARFRGEHAKHGSLYEASNQYIYELMIQISQTAACNVSHPVVARLGRWLLMTRDRMGTDQFRLTHELLGSMLGVLRGAVTTSAGILQQRKLITYTRGEITILNSKGLEAAACRCYQVVKPSGGGMPRARASRGAAPSA